MKEVKRKQYTIVAVRVSITTYVVGFIEEEAIIEALKLRKDGYKVHIQVL